MPVLRRDHWFKKNTKFLDKESRSNINPGALDFPLKKPPSCIFVIFMLVSIRIPKHQTTASAVTSYILNTTQPQTRPNRVTSVRLGCNPCLHHSCYSDYRMTPVIGIAVHNVALPFAIFHWICGSFICLVYLTNRPHLRESNTLRKKKKKAYHSSYPTWKRRTNEAPSKTIQTWNDRDLRG